jgi:hypothetical protein
MKDPRQGAKPISVGASYFGNRILRHLATDIEDLAERGFTGVLHTFSEHGLARGAGLRDLWTVLTGYAAAGS